MPTVDGGAVSSVVAEGHTCVAVTHIAIVFEGAPALLVFPFVQSDFP